MVGDAQPASTTEQSAQRQIGSFLLILFTPVQIERARGDGPAPFTSSATDSRIAAY